MQNWWKVLLLLGKRKAFIFKICRSNKHRTTRTHSDQIYICNLTILASRVFRNFRDMGQRVPEWILEMYAKFMIFVFQQYYSIMDPFEDDVIKCPRPMRPRTKSLWCSVLRTKLPLIDTSLTDVSRPWTDRIAVIGSKGGPQPINLTQTDSSPYLKCNLCPPLAKGHIFQGMHSPTDESFVRGHTDRWDKIAMQLF
jgi:hypothetical protein